MKNEFTVIFNVIGNLMTKSIDLYPYLKTDMYLTSLREERFVSRNSDDIMSVYSKDSESYLYVHISRFKTDGYIKFDTCVEHESHYYRNDILQASGRYFSMMFDLLKQQMSKDQFLIPEEDLQKQKEITYRIDSHSWGTVIEYCNKYNSTNEFIQCKVTKTYNLNRERSKMGKVNKNTDHIVNKRRKQLLLP